MEKRTLLLLAVCATLQAVVHADVKGDVCTNIDTSGGAVNVEDTITIPYKFAANVEVVVPSTGGTKGRVTNVKMHYDDNQAYLKLSADNTKEKYQFYYDYMFLQTMKYDLFSDSSPGKCTLGKSLSASNEFWLIPEPPTTKITEDGQLGPPSYNVLRLSGPDGFGGQIQLYKDAGQVNVRDLPVSKYTSCQKIPVGDKKMIVKVTHYISDNKFTQLESGSVPIQIMMEGMYEDGSDSNKYTRTYNFFHYETTTKVRDSFEHPIGVVCAGRESNAVFPDIPKYFSAVQEVHTIGLPVENIKVQYNQHEGYVLNEYFDSDPNAQNNYRYDDFNTGIAYTIDPNVWTCDVQNISDAADVNDENKNTGAVTIKTPAQFFGLEGIDWHYNGLRHFRGIETEAWIGSKPNDPSSIFEWYFITGLEYSVNDYASVENGQYERIPYKRLYWNNGQKDYNSLYFFQVDYTVPERTPNLLPCYTGNQKMYLSVEIPGLDPEVFNQDKMKVIRDAQETTAKALNIGKIRIQMPNIACPAKLCYFSFSLLEKAPYSKDVTQPNEPTMAEAIELLKTKCADKSLQYQVGNGYDEIIGSVCNYAGTDGYMIAARTASQTAAGYSSGSMAGLAFGMIIVGLAAGGGGGYWFFIKR